MMAALFPAKNFISFRVAWFISLSINWHLFNWLIYKSYHCIQSKCVSDPGLTPMLTYEGWSCVSPDVFQDVRPEWLPGQAGIVEWKTIVQETWDGAVTELELMGKPLVFHVFSRKLKYWTHFDYMISPLQEGLRSERGQVSFNWCSSVEELQTFKLVFALILFVSLGNTTYIDFNLQPWDSLLCSRKFEKCRILLTRESLASRSHPTEMRQKKCTMHQKSALFSPNRGTSTFDMSPLFNISFRVSEWADGWFDGGVEDNWEKYCLMTLE